jgi:hypothetical protein
MLKSPEPKKMHCTLKSVLVFHAVGKSALNPLYYGKTRTFKAQHTQECEIQP